MFTPIQNLSFQASWTEDALPYKPYVDTDLKKQIYNIISIAIPIIGLCRLVYKGLQELGRRFILPASFYSEEVREQTRSFFDFVCRQIELSQYYTIDPVDIKTADGVSLSTHYFRHKNSTDEMKVVLVCHPNAESYKQFHRWVWMMKEALERGEVLDFVVFDYRGVGDSEGNPSSMSKLALDVLAVNEYIEKILKKKPEQKIVYGYSLGGALGSLVPASKFIHDRSMSSISKVAKSILPAPLTPVGMFFGWLIPKIGWEMDVKQNIISRKADELFILYHSKDSIINERSALHPDLPEGFNARIRELKGFDDKFPHGVPLELFQDKQGNPVITEVVDFILGESRVSADTLVG